MRPVSGWLTCFCALALAGCGSRSATVADAPDARTPGPVEDESCNGLDDDGDTAVDETFRDSSGRYVNVDHCGSCGRACSVLSERELEVGCVVVDEVPTCGARRCAAGFAVSRTARCIPAFAFLCLPCAVDGDCGDVAGARCALVGSEGRCAIPCSAGCPDGYRCGADDLCVPVTGSCSCSSEQDFDLACVELDGLGGRCPGTTRCMDGVLAECNLPEERCDETDNDCDGLIDESFRDGRGSYRLDPRHCGRCGVDCTRDPGTSEELTCGGDPFSPSCVLLCPDLEDGIDPGDKVDADRDISTGCECTVSSLDDAAGPTLRVGEELDTNCDGADGVVTDSYYVALDGDDGNIGSPTLPLRTISEAVRQAQASLEGDAPRPHVFVAAGSYTEALEVPDGVLLHGGYRRDFLALDPTGFRVELRAPADTTAPGGAALVLRYAGSQETAVDWLTVIGRDATTPGTATFAAFVEEPGAALSLRENEFRSGVPGRGTDGVAGPAGQSPPGSSDASRGAPPRGAEENAARQCISSDANQVSGGLGGVRFCGGANVSGGNGGTSGCPSFAEFQPRGRPGQGNGAGAGGAGGQDTSGPITGSACPSSVCCGLADFTAPTMFSGPRPGNAGRAGAAGTPGRSCSEPLGGFFSGLWVGDTGTPGSDGSAGGGGGGGGAGGGTEMEFMDVVCEFADGLGGGGGGGGAGGCGGQGGGIGTSGGPAVALLIVSSAELPSLRDNLFVSRDGARGGDGGNGGEGGAGGLGAAGGALPREARTTPTLSAPFPGAAGGAGGDGGGGGGGGAGCGGSSVGVWVTGGASASTSAIRSSNRFEVGQGGVPGRGGGGEAPAAAGEEGESIDVVVR